MGVAPKDKRQFLSAADFSNIGAVHLLLFTWLARSSSYNSCPGIIEKTGLYTFTPGLLKHTTPMAIAYGITMPLQRTVSASFLYTARLLVLPNLFHYFSTG